MASTEPGGIMSAADLVQYTEKMEWEKARKTLAKMEQHKKEETDLKSIFMAQKVKPDAADRVMSVVRRAAEDGKRQVQVVRFPSSYCNDGGRRINNSKPDWPDSLEGFAKHAYLWYVENLQPKGYKLSAQVVDFKGGMPGDIALFLRW